MAFGVDDVFEMVDVEHQHGHRLRATNRAAAVLLQLLIDVATVVTTGQRIDATQAIELRVAFPELVLQSFDPHCSTDAGDELGRLERLLEVVVGSGTQAGDHLIGFRSAGGEHDRDVAQVLVLLQSQQDFVTVQAGHFDVEEDGMGFDLGALDQSGSPVDRFDYFVALGLELIAEDGAYDE